MLKLYLEGIKMLFRKYLLRQSTGTVIKKFAEKMGIVYIKLAQILATQNLGNVFTEKDRIVLSELCDNSNPIDYTLIKEELELNYQGKVDEIFSCISETPVGAASISQVHKGVLKSGEVVAIKVKRKDISNTIEKDINNIRKLMNRFGKLVKFKNFIGGDHALDLYIKWIKEETDFRNEKDNILKFQAFADEVNQKTDDCKNIVLPKIYEEYCTENIIVMEFIEYPTINKLPLNEENQKKIQEAVNSYLKNSFYALFHGKDIIFHGDPHSGNIYIDTEGNIGFLDMGLVFEISADDKKLLLAFFAAAYTSDVDRLYELLRPYGEFSESTNIDFKNDIYDFCEFIKDKPVTVYFTDMMTRVLKYNFDPPKFLYCMAKPFLCLNGMNVFSKNVKDAVELLQEQVIEYFVSESLSKTKDLFKTSIEEGMNLTKIVFEKGISKGVSKVLTESTLKEQLIDIIETNYQLMTLARQIIKKK